MRTEMMNGRKYFVYDRDSEELPDMTALKMLERNDIEGLLPFQYVRRENINCFRYEAGGGETLEEWLMRAQYRRDVTGLLESLICLEKETEAYLLEQGHICTEPSFIIVEGGSCKAAYIPGMGSSYESLLELAQKIAASVKYALDEDFGYLFDLQNAFGRKDIRCMDDLKKWLKIVNGEDIESAVQQLPDGEEGIAQPAPVAREKEHSPKPVYDVRIPGSAADSLEGVFGDLGLTGKNRKEKPEKPEKHPFFSLKSKKKEKRGGDVDQDIMREAPAPVPNAAPSREIINDLERGDFTVMMDVEPIATLLHTGNHRQYILERNSYSIGSGAQADIVIQENKTISRNHARIFQNGGSWYIEDMGSTNGTCVNGERLRKMEPYKLEDGARLQLSNENYIFQMS